jgi:hypothetical protein
MKKIIFCEKCGKSFILTEKTQTLLDDKGWAHPKKCLNCRDKGRKGLLGKVGTKEHPPLFNYLKQKD